MKHDSKRPISVDDLLRLKRAERPVADFWAGFDQALRAKQLAALVEKRPWWHSLPSPFALISRHRVPFGAAAAFALTLMVVREYRASASRSLANVTPAGVAHVISPPASTESIESGAVSAAPSSPASASLTPPQTAFVESVKVISAGVADVDPMPATLPVAGALSATDQAPSAGLHFSVGLNSVPVGGADLAGATRLLAASAGFEARALPTVRAAVDPLQQMTPPGESRRASRLLTAMVSPAALQTSSRVTERAASRIAEESLYDQVSRFGARGNQLNVKF